MEQKQLNNNETTSTSLSIAEQFQVSRGVRILGTSEMYLTVATEFEVANAKGLLGKKITRDYSDSMYKFAKKELSITFEDGSVCEFYVCLSKLSSKDYIVQTRRFVQILVDDLGLTRAAWKLEGSNTAYFTKNTRGIKGLKQRIKNALDYFFTIDDYTDGDIN